MNEKILQYTILRYRHDLLTKEFLNIGLVAYCPETFEFRCEFIKKFSRISSTFPGVDIGFLQKYIAQLQAKFNRTSSEINSHQMELVKKYPSDLAELVNYLLPYDDSSLYFSEVYKSSFIYFANTFDELNKRLICTYQKEKSKERRNDHEIWESFKKPLADLEILPKLKSYLIDVKYDQLQFDYGWNNGKVKVLQPISLDIVNPTIMRKKGREWVGNITLLDNAKQLSDLFLLVGKPTKNSPELLKAYDDIKGMFQNKPKNYEVTIVEEVDAIKFAERMKPIIEKDLAYHK